MKLTRLVRYEYGAGLVNSVPKTMHDRTKNDYLTFRVLVDRKTSTKCTSFGTNRSEFSSSSYCNRQTWTNFLPVSSGARLPPLVEDSHKEWSYSRRRFAFCNHDTLSFRLFGVHEYSILFNVWDNISFPHNFWITCRHISKYQQISHQT